MQRRGGEDCSVEATPPGTALRPGLARGSACALFGEHGACVCFSRIEKVQNVKFST